MGYSKEIVWDKTPNEVLDYTVDWRNWLGSDTISTDSWEVDTGITAGTTIDNGALRTIWLSGGTAGTTYKITNIIETVGGRTAKRSFYINTVAAR